MSGKSTIEIWLDRYGAKKLTEKSLGRLLKHVEPGESFALITGYRREHTLEENEKFHNKLLHDIRSAQLGAARTQGTYYMTMPDGTKEQIFEQIWFVYKIPKETARKLAKKYGQGAVMWGQKGMGVFNILTDGTKTKVGTKLTLKVLADAYTLKGKRFEALSYIPSGYISAIGWMLEMGETDPLGALKSE